MLFDRLRKLRRGDFVVIDPVFPQKEPLAFRNVEITEYLNRIKNCESYTMCPMQPDVGAWFSHGYGITKEQFLENKTGYLRYHKGNEDKIHYLEEDRQYSFKLAYSYFLAETYVLLPFYEKNKIPFTFVLYPGGAFGLDFDKSDEMLTRICSSPYFRGVIVTQAITRDYLIKKNICPAEKIEYIYGGFVQFEKDDVRPKKFYKKDKSTFDICFVAAKYSEKGVDKGYDLFIDAAKKICQQTDDVMFHVVGGFDENDIDVSDISERITFYGYKRPDFLREFYAGMDIFIGPGRPAQLFEGNFDGFPLGIDPGYCGVALFVADELKMNTYYKEDKEIVIVPLDAAVIAEKVMRYYGDIKAFYRLARAGQKVTQRLFDTNHQIEERLKFFGKFVDLESTVPLNGGNKEMQ